MDIIQSLVSQLGIDPGRAESLAGTVLGGVKGMLEQKDPAAAAQLGSAVPEIDRWKGQADEAQTPGLAGGLAGMLGGGGLGQMLGSAGAALEGAGQLAGLASVVEKLGLDRGQAATILPLIVAFLKSRLDPSTFEAIARHVPLLSGAPEAGGGLLGSLGGLFGSR